MPGAHRALSQTHGADSGPLEPVPQPHASAPSGLTSRTTEAGVQPRLENRLQTWGEGAGEGSRVWVFSAQGSPASHEMVKASPCPAELTHYHL